jgi:hypothetical protein
MIMQHTQRIYEDFELLFEESFLASLWQKLCQIQGCLRFHHKVYAYPCYHCAKIIIQFTVMKESLMDIFACGRACAVRVHIWILLLGRLSRNSANLGL